MIVPNWQDPQFIDANGPSGLNAAMGTVSGSIALLVSGANPLPGLQYPEAMTVSFTGLVATVTLPAPFTVIGSNGVTAQAHGTQTGADTQTYTVTFSGLVPGAGTNTAYCVATLSSIQQGPVPVPGPPPGHPSYNSNFQPVVGYAQNVDTLIVSGTTTAPNNTTSFELFRTTLTAGQSGITSWSYANQQRVTPYRAQQIQSTSGGVLTAAQAQGILAPEYGGIVSTLPLSVSGAGVQYNLLNTSNSSWTINTQGTDAIRGALFNSNAPGVNTTSVILPQNAAISLYCDGTTWFLAGMNANFASPGILSFTTGRLLGVQIFTGSSTYTPLSGTTTSYQHCYGAGGGAAGSPATTGSTVSAGGGGGAGSYTWKKVANPTAQSVVVGVGGAGGTGSAGTAGGASSIGSYLSAGGGGGGATGGPTGVTTNFRAAGGAGGIVVTAGDFAANGLAGNISSVLTTPYLPEGIPLLGTPGMFMAGYGYGGAPNTNPESAGALTGESGQGGIVICYDFS